MTVIVPYIILNKRGLGRDIWWRMDAPHHDRWYQLSYLRPWSHVMRTHIFIPLCKADQYRQVLIRCHTYESISVSFLYSYLLLHNIIPPKSHLLPFTMFSFPGYHGISFDCLALNCGIIPTSFAGVDSFHKTRFRFIAGHLPILLQETETGGGGDILPFHLIVQL